MYNGAFLCWIYFLLATFFNLIVMLNLLIAIISDTYTRISERQTQLAYQTKAQIILEYIYLNVDETEYGAEQRNERDRMLITAMETEKRVTSNKEKSLNDVMKELKYCGEKVGSEIIEVKSSVLALQPEVELLD